MDIHITILVHKDGQLPQKEKKINIKWIKDLKGRDKSKKLLGEKKL